MEQSAYNQEYRKELLMFLDQLLYSAFLLKKENDYENISMRGLVITEKEMEQVFSLLSREEHLPSDAIEILKEQRTLILDIEKEAGDTLPFYRLCEDFRLTGTERLALLLGAAPCFNRKYERIYGYLQDHVDLPNPTRGLCVTLAEFMGETEEEEMSDFLTGNGNLEYLLEAKAAEGKGLSAVYRLKPRVQEYLQGSMEPAHSLKGRCESFLWVQGESPMEIRRDYLDRLCRLWDRLMKEEQQAAKGGGDME